MLPEQSGGNASHDKDKDEPHRKSRPDGRHPGGPKPQPKRSDLAPPLLFLDDFASDLSAELRKQTFFDVIRGRSSETQLPETVRQISLSELSGTSSTEQHLVVRDASPIGTYAPAFVEKVQDLELAEFKSEGTIKQEQILFNRFIAAIANKVLFQFREPSYLHTFGEVLIPWLEHEKNLCTKLHLRLHVFYDAEDWRSMSVYEKTDGMPHGYYQRAGPHLKYWVKALQAVIEAAKICRIEAKVDLIFHRPFHNYLAIRAQCDFVFRQEEIGDNGSRIELNMLCVDTAAWSEVLLHRQAEDIKDYYTLLACSVFGKKLPQPVTERLVGDPERLKMLIAFGCIGIREYSGGNLSIQPV
ncbi:hypothetical protein CKM354_000007500 [Cercospora kikuchii]|uniref:Uncharacterized protein n=1 Tax=Cercospora kikuchii TaxID=84275 RepID=A0A9P3CA45_9PEZI|nr:uncharacterized protein CKM354_000007500 [Cercospora kikuchii]GIZ36605.1 hypothetical protein CKM354_000007500 [Cercospora kikuchii]